LVSLGHGCQCGERDGASNYSKVKQMGEAVSRLHLVWVDGGFDGAPFMRWVMDVCHWTRAGRVAPKEHKGSYCPSVGWWNERWAGSVGVGANKDYELLPKTAETFICHDPHYGQAIGMK